MSAIFYNPAKKGRCPARFSTILTPLLFLFPWAVAAGADIDRPPVNYTKATPKNRVSELQERIDKGLTKLAFDDEHGYLKAVLGELKIPLSSQVLVFSKTSFQAKRIGPKTPRALYFN